ncbi:MAG: CHAD domain-containing protein [Puniceicoccaceae bacterium]
MSYKFSIGESAGDGIRRMAVEQIDRTLEEIADSGLDRHDTIHQARKHCKKIRALLRLGRGDLDGGSAVYERENKCFRDASRALSEARDAEVLVETFDMLAETFGDQIDLDRLRSVRASLEERKAKASGGEETLEERIARFAEAIGRARERVADWPIGDDFGSLGPGLEKTYKRGRRALESVAGEPATANFHEWRKRVKYHRYHVRVLRSVWEDVLDAWRDALHDLSDLLGDDHDLAVFGKTLSEERGRFDSKRDVQALLGLADRRRAQLQAKAFPLGRRAFAEKPGHLVRRFETYWAAARSDIEQHSSKLEANVRVPADD